MNTPVFFKSAGDERGTPQDFFDRLNAEFHFDVDCAASAENRKCELYFGFGGVTDDALKEDWGGEGTTCWLNPPYSVVDVFITKAREEADKGAVVVLLLPVRSDTKYWHKHIWDKDAFGDHQATQTFANAHPGSAADGAFRPGVRCRFIPGRLTFELHVSDAIREWVKDAIAEETIALKDLVETTGLPRMAIERICQDMPDDCLLEGAPFPSCVVIFSKP